MQQKHSPKWFYIAIPIISTVFTILLIEVSFETFYPIPFSIESNMYFEADPYTGYSLKPNATGYFQQQIPAQTNRHGHRDDIVSIDKPEGTFRILLLGDSFTVGANVAQDSAYAQVLEAQLNINNTTPIEVINSGVGGWEPFQYAQYYEFYGRKFSPDLILIGFFVGNDTYRQANDVGQMRTAVLGRRISRKAAADSFITLKVFLYNHFNIARLIFKTGPNKRDVTRKNCSDLSRNYIAIQRRKVNNHLKRSKRQEDRAKNGIYQVARIKNLAEKDSIPLGVILIPDENQINTHLQKLLLPNEQLSEYDFNMPQAMLVDMFHDIAVPVIALLPFFKEDSRCLYMNDTHWTAEGHALAAEIIYNEIVDGGIWPILTNKVRLSGIRRGRPRLKKVK